MNTIALTKKSNAAISALLALSLVAYALMSTQVHAAALTQTLVRFDRMKINQATTGTVCAKPATTATEASVQVTYPTSYTLGLAATFTVNTTNLAWPAGASAWPGVGTATNVTGQVVTFPSTDLTVGTLYCFNWINTAAVSIKSSATASNTGTITTRDSVPTAIDTLGFATASITDDQIVVTATVPQSFSFALSANADAIGTLATGSVTSSPTPRTATVNTNAKNGWTVWAQGANTGLASASAGATIPATTPGSNSVLSAGTAGYNTGVTQAQTSGTGTITVAAPFVGGASTGGGLDTSLRALATSNGTANGGVLTLTNNVAISTITPSAGDYTDTITVVGAGLF